MKTTIKTILTLTLVMGLGIMANAQKTATAPASATVLADLTITLDATQNEIAFGTLSASTPAGVVLDANGTANANTGTVTNVARFDLAGSEGASVTVNYDATVTLTNGTPLQDMTMTTEVVGDALAANQATAVAVGIGTQVTLTDPNILLPTGSVYFLWVGGSLPALASQATGTYTGTFNIDVEYN